MKPALGSAQGGAANHTGRHGAPGKRRSAQSCCSWLRAETTAAGVHSSWTCSTRQPAVKLEGRKLRGPPSGPGCDEPLACVGAAAAREQRRCGPCARVAARCVLGGLGPRGAGATPRAGPLPCHFERPKRRRPHARALRDVRRRPTPPPRTCSRPATRAPRTARPGGVCT